MWLEYDFSFKKTQTNFLEFEESGEECMFLHFGFIIIC